MPNWNHDGLAFNYADVGEGLPFVFQHGLGGDAGQPLSLFEPPPGVRLVVLETRGHGQTVPLGPLDKISLGQSARDVLSLVDHLDLVLPVIGGISMGAALALRLVLDWPGRFRAVVLSRPAWLVGPNRRNQQIFERIADLIDGLGTARGRAEFLLSDDYRRVLQESADSAASLLGQFDRARAAETTAILRRIPADSACDDLDQLGQIKVPALVMANRQDVIHPFEYGVEISGRISGSRFVELTPKSTSIESHRCDVQRALVDFLQTILTREGVATAEARTGRRSSG